MATPTLGSPTQSFELPPPRRRRTMLVAALTGGIGIVGTATAAVLWQGQQEAATRTGSGASVSGSASVLPQQSPAREVLMRRSVVELEAELERVAVLRGHDSKAVMEAMTAYYERARDVPSGSDAETHRHTVLTEQILAWVGEPAATTSEASIAELEAVFLRMNSPLDLQERRLMLTKAKDLDGASPDAIRSRLLSLIDTYGLDYQTGDPGAELVLEDEPSTTD